MYLLSNFGSCNLDTKSITSILLAQLRSIIHSVGMDLRNSPHNPFARPLSEQIIRDQRDRSRPPPPPPPPLYTLQAPVRQSQPTLARDPFIPRRRERDDSRQGSANSLSQSPFGLRKYAATLTREALGLSTMPQDGMLSSQDSRETWRSADGRVHGNGGRNIEGEPNPRCFICLCFNGRVMRITTEATSSPSLTSPMA